MIIFIKKISLTKIAEFFGISHSYILKIKNEIGKDFVL